MADNTIEPGNKIEIIGELFTQDELIAEIKETARLDFMETNDGAEPSDEQLNNAVDNFMDTAHELLHGESPYGILLTVENGAALVMDILEEAPDAITFNFSTPELAI